MRAYDGSQFTKVTSNFRNNLYEIITRESTEKYWMEKIKKYSYSKRKDGVGTNRKSVQINIKGKAEGSDQMELQILRYKQISSKIERTDAPELSSLRCGRRRHITYLNLSTPRSPICMVENNQKARRLDETAVNGSGPSAYYNGKSPHMEGE